MRECNSHLGIFDPVEVPNVFRIHVVGISYPVNILMCPKSLCFWQSDRVLLQKKHIKHVKTFCNTYVWFWFLCGKETYVRDITNFGIIFQTSYIPFSCFLALKHFYCCNSCNIIFETLGQACDLIYRQQLTKMNINLKVFVREIIKLIKWLLTCLKHVIPEQYLCIGLTLDCHGYCPVKKIVESWMIVLFF